MVIKLNIKQLITPLAIIAVVVAAIIGTTKVSADSNSTIKTSDKVTVAGDQTIDSSFFGAGQTIDIQGTVNGDVYFAGQNVTISGTVKGDIIGAAAKVTIDGDVAGNVRVAAQYLTINGSVDKNATVIAQEFSLGKEGSIGNDIALLTASATLDGRVGRDITLASGDLKVSGDVSRNIEGAVSSLNILENGYVGGDITYTSDKDISLSDNSVVGGTINRKTTTDKPVIQTGALFGFASLLVVIIAACLLIPRLLEAVTNRALPRPWKALLVGFVSVIVVPIIFILLALTVIGLQLAFILMLVWAALMLLGHIAFIYYLGRLVTKSKQMPIITGLIGFVLSVILLLIPLVNVVVAIFGSFVGIGSVLIEIKHRRPYYYKKDKNQKKRRTVAAKAK